MQISGLATAHIKINQIPHVIFGTKSQFFFKLHIVLFSVMRHNASVLFHLNIYMLWTNRFNQSASFLTLTACMKINEIPYVIFQATSQFLINFAQHISVSLQCQTVYALDKKSPSMYNFQTFGCSNESSTNFSCHF